MCVFKSSHVNGGMPYLAVGSHHGVAGVVWGWLCVGGLLGAGRALGREKRDMSGAEMPQGEGQEVRLIGLGRAGETA